jgi:hypothetical protein
VDWTGVSVVFCGAHDLNVMTYLYLQYIALYLVVVYCIVVLTTYSCALLSSLLSALTCRSVVPYYRIVRAVEECVEALAEKQKKE